MLKRTTIDVVTIPGEHNPYSSHVRSIIGDYMMQHLRIKVGDELFYAANFKSNAIICRVSSCTPSSNITTQIVWHRAMSHHMLAS